MATKLYFSRDTKVIAHVPMATAGTQSMYYDIPVLDGFSFSQATNTSEITLNEAQSTSGVVEEVERCLTTRTHQLSGVFPLT